MRDCRQVAELADEGGDTGITVNVVLEGHNVKSWNRVLGLPDVDEGGVSESWENAEGGSDELLGEHGNLELRSPSSESTSYLSNFIHLRVQGM